MRFAQAAVWLIALLALGCGRKEAPADAPAPQPPSQPPSPQATPAPLTGAPVPPICADLCKRAVSLACGTVESCADGCRQMLALPICQTETMAFLTCAAAEPDANWDCDPGGPTPSLKDGHCESQKVSLAACLEHGKG